MEKHFNIHITGKVQRIGFRYSAQQEAIRLGICGYAENRSDGSVFIEAEGDEEAISRFLEWCQHGPPWARVDTIKNVPSAMSYFKGFFTR